MAIKGVGAHLSRMRRLVYQTGPEIARSLYAAGQNIEIDAEISITAGSVSGKNHVPSKPGEPPNADTRVLDSNIETKLEDTRRPRVTVTSHAPYSAPLEYGTEKMAARPFMRPALEKNKKAVTGSVRGAVNRVIRQGVASIRSESGGDQ